MNTFREPVNIVAVQLANLTSRVARYRNNYVVLICINNFSCLYIKICVNQYSVFNLIY